MSTRWEPVSGWLVVGLPGVKNGRRARSTAPGRLRRAIAKRTPHTRRSSPPVDSSQHSAPPNLNMTLKVT
jgi:hypothetical protein